MHLSLGQMFILGFYGKIVPDWLKQFSAEFGLGGVILFDYSCQTKTYENNIESPQQVRELCEQIHSLPSRPLIFVDQEGGKVRRLKEKRGFKNLPSAQAFSLLSIEQKIQLLEEAYQEMRALGIDVNLSPVVDVNYNPSNPDIGAVERSFSPDVGVVKKNAELVISVAEKYRVGAVLKHFPGLGGATVNSHLELTDISNSLREEELFLFGELLQTMSSPAVLVSHGVVRQWDQKPLSISAVAVEKIRSTSPQALIVTDDMQMQGLQRRFTTEESCYLALAAGSDMFCVGNNMINQEAQMLSLVRRLHARVLRETHLTANARASIARIEGWKRSL